MTIYDIKARLKSTGSHFFSRETMKFFGQTMKSFSKKKQKNGKYLILADRKRCMGRTKYEYDPETNTIKYVGSEQ